MIRKISGYVNELHLLIHNMIEARKVANVIENEAQKAQAYNDTVLPYLPKIRVIADKLEMIVDDELWTLPKYRELLFFR